MTESAGKPDPIQAIVDLLRADTLPAGVTREEVTARAADALELFVGARIEWAFGSTAWPDVFHPEATEARARDNARDRAIGAWTGFTARRLVTPYRIAQRDLTNRSPDSAI